MVGFSKDFGPETAEETWELTREARRRGRGPLHFCTEKARRRGAENREKPAARPKEENSGPRRREKGARGAEKRKQARPLYYAILYIIFYTQLYTLFYDVFSKLYMLFYTEFYTLFYTIF